MCVGVYVCSRGDCLHAVVYFYFFSLFLCLGATLISVVQRPPGIIRHTFIGAGQRQHGC